eukprot:jgi/Psemu1/40990/gm1.40990_g
MKESTNRRNVPRKGRKEWSSEKSTGGKNEEPGGIDDRRNRKEITDVGGLKERAPEKWIPRKEPESMPRREPESMVESTGEYAEEEDGEEGSERKKEPAEPTK